MNSQIRSICASLVVACMGGELYAQNTSDLINDQIASHFSMVFSDRNSVYAPERSSWVPGNDKEPMFLDSVWMMDASFTQVLETDIVDFPDHDVSVRYGEFGMSVTVPLKPRHKLSFAFNTMFFRSEESTNDSQKILEVEDARSWDAGFLYRYGLNPKWELLAGAGLSLTRSDNDELGGKMTLLGYAGASYSFNPNLNVAFAFSVSSREYYGKKPFPMFVLDWRINDRNRITVGDGFLYQYSLNKSWTDVAGFEVRGAVIALQMDDGYIDGAWHRDAVFVLEDVGVALTYRHTFQNGLKLITRLGITHVGNQAYWENDETFRKVEFEPTPGFGIGLQYRF